MDVVSSVWIYSRLTTPVSVSIAEESSVSRLDDLASVTDSYLEPTEIE